MLQVKSYLLILYLVQLVIAAFFVQGGNATLQLSFTGRQGDSNVITLRCRNESAGALEQRTTFFLNDTELTTANYPSFVDQDNLPGEVTFRINRRLEGMYSCGIGQVRSNPTSLITYPTGDASIIRPARENTYYAVAGDTAVLECAVSPGALIHYYHVTWLNGSRPLFRQSLPSQRNSTFPDSVDPRYRLDPMNLSLIIDGVRRSDSIQDYHCDLRVVDPQSGFTREYAVASRVNISLTILSPPIITASPRKSTIRQGDNAIFSCKAEGYPLPKISWTHNGRVVTNHHPDYLVSPSIDDENKMVTSDLRIFSVNPSWSGKVTCIASANTPEDSGIILANHTASTSLTVLGHFRKFDVLISTDGDVIVSLVLPTEYDQPIHLFLRYTNDHDTTQSYNRTTEIGFLNTKSVQYMEYSSQVHYDRFQLEAGLVSGSREVLGPLYKAPGVYDTSTTTFCESGFDPLYHIMFGGCGALLIILCIAFLFAIVIIVIKKDNDLLKYVDSVKEQLQDCATSTSEIPEDSPIPPPSSGEVEVAAGSEPPASGQGREQTVEENHGTPRSSRRQRRLLGKGGYKNHPVYKPMKRVLVGAHLSDRKHQMVLKHIRKECETCAP